MSTPPTPVIGVSVIIFRDHKAQEILLVERGKEPYKGYWSPPGGRVEAGETIIAAAAREVMEECAIALYFPAHAPFTTLDRIRTTPEGELLHHFVLAGVTAVAEEGAVPIAGDDAADCKWVDIADLAAIQPQVEDLDWVIGLAKSRLDF